MIFLSLERRDPNLYYGIKQLYFGSVKFKFTGGGKHPLRKTCYKKQKQKQKQNKKRLRNSRVKRCCNIITYLMVVLVTYF